MGWQIYRCTWARCGWCRLQRSRERAPRECQECFWVIMLHCIPTFSFSILSTGGGTYFMNRKCAFLFILNIKNVTAGLSLWLCSEFTPWFCNLPQFEADVLWNPFRTARVSKKLIIPHWHSTHRSGRSYSTWTDQGHIARHFISCQMSGLAVWKKSEKVLGFGYLSKALWACGLAWLIFQKLSSWQNSLKLFSDVIAVSALAQSGCNFATQVNCGQTEILYGRLLLSWLQYIDLI